MPVQDGLEQRKGTSWLQHLRGKVEAFEGPRPDERFRMWSGS
jgi:hypothetical protein